MSEPTQFWSPDGRYWWDGQQWLAAQPPPPPAYHAAAYAPAPPPSSHFLGGFLGCLGVGAAIAVVVFLALLAAGAHDRQQVVDPYQGPQVTYSTPAPTTDSVPSS